MTDSQKSRFLARFSKDYNLPAAAVAAGISRGDAYLLLQSAADEVDRLVRTRLSDATLAAIRREYESLAFGDPSAVRPGDRMRALEELRAMAAAEQEDGGAPPLTIRYEYV